jgi:predicted tellurium resistance membrane protein TerC
MSGILTLAGDPAAWVALGTLIVMEVVLGIDNLLFISILTNKLPEHQRARARFIGIGAALVLRLALLSLVFLIVQLVEPVLTLFGQSFSWRDLILIGGGLFLVWKATKEIHHNVDPAHAPDVFDGGGSGGGGSAVVGVAYAAIIGQILLLDLVFSLDSIITAVGMTDHIEIMVIAVIFTVGVMLFAANPLGNFIGNNPSVVLLALSFLLMIGMTLIAEGFGVKVPKGYVYAAMAFSAVVEGLNMVSRRVSARRAARKAAARMPVQR